MHVSIARGSPRTVCPTPPGAHNGVICSHLNTNKYTCFHVLLVLQPAVGADQNAVLFSQAVYRFLIIYNIVVYINLNTYIHILLTAYACVLSLLLKPTVDAHQRAVLFSQALYLLLIVYITRLHI